MFKDNLCHRDWSVISFAKYIIVSDLEQQSDEAVRS